MFKLFKRKKLSQAEIRRANYEVIKKDLKKSQAEVWLAIAEINRPVCGRSIARYMSIDSACVTPRLSELVKKGKLKVHNQTKCADGIIRKFYVVVE